MGVGLPALMALWLRQPGGMLLGVITAIMFSFADDEGPLARRFTALGRSAGGIALGGAVGHLLGGYGVLFWLLLSQVHSVRRGSTAPAKQRISVPASR